MTWGHNFNETTPKWAVPEMMELRLKLARRHERKEKGHFLMNYHSSSSSVKDELFVLLVFDSLPSFSCTFVPLGECMCSVGVEPPRRSQPAGHSSLVINVYWHNIHTLRSQFLVCMWKMLLECHTKWGVGAFPPKYQFPINLQKAECLLLRLSGAPCCFYFIVSLCLSFSLNT